MFLFGFRSALYLLAFVFNFDWRCFDNCFCLLFDWLRIIFFLNWLLCLNNAYIFSGLCSLLNSFRLLFSIHNIRSPHFMNRVNLLFLLLIL